ncbi:MAG: aldo/keto reductase [Bryobacteraceae bacterium]
MTAKGPVLTLNNGVSMPAFGLGVYQSRPHATADAVKVAIADGYGLIDTAAAYLNEQQVGEGIRQSEVDRSQIFVATKLWLSDYGYDQTLHAFDRSMRKLHLDYLDLYLLHWPVPTDFENTVASYKAAEKLLADKRVRAIGVCNFTAKDLENLIARSSVTPAVNQVELHPFFAQKELREAHVRLGVVTQAWSPIGGVNRYWVRNGQAPKDPLAQFSVVRLGEKYGKTPAQIVLRWQIQLGNSVIPKSVHSRRIAENIDIFDFALTAEEMATINSLDTGKRGGPDPEEVNARLFPIKIED